VTSPTDWRFLFDSQLFTKQNQKNNRRRGRRDRDTQKRNFVRIKLTVLQTRKFGTSKGRIDSILKRRNILLRGETPNIKRISTTVKQMRTTEKNMPHKLERLI
jgi:hypothetical protein